MKNNLKHFFARTLFPLIMGGAMVAGFLTIESGTVKNVLTAGTPIILVALIVIALFERVFPYKKSWNKNNNDIQNDTWHLVFTQIIIGRIMGPLWIFLLAGITATLAESYGGTIWPGSWNIFGQ